MEITEMGISSKFLWTFNHTRKRGEIAPRHDILKQTSILKQSEEHMEIKREIGGRGYFFGARRLADTRQSDSELRRPYSYSWDRDPHELKREFRLSSSLLEVLG